MELFKPEVYEKLEKKLTGPSDHCGIEEALDMIREDKKLQKFLKEYAIKNGVRKTGDQYLVGNKNVELIICSNEKKDEYDRINLGLDHENDIMPIIFRHRHYEDGDYWGESGYVYKCYELTKTEKGYVMKKLSDYYNAYSNKRLIDTGIFDNFTKKDVLDGLEKAINKLLEGDKHDKQ